ncbi:MAG TPA: alpha/beta hydrolase [Syntrophorhabdaceae bacterium]|nr:alpha/beta hydrolase [Syntrophorhabdaceae bacterium]HPU28725.1 alpha/beta hydrolase [Syntrophorhabdaceae bacterium]
MIIHTSEKKPWIVLIHGLGVSENVWFDPIKEKVLFLSFKSLLKNEKDITPFTERLKGTCNIASWSQDKKSTIDEAANELKNICNFIGNKKFIFLAHSRGGLVARRAIQLFNLKPEAIICLSSPHYGSYFADIVIRYKKILTIFMPSIKEFLKPIEELSPNSNFIKALNAHDALKKEEHIPHFDIFGNSTTYVKMGFLDIMGSIERIFRNRTIDEWKNGYGDGFVSTKSTISPLTPPEHAYTLPVNHLNILIDNKTWGIVNSIFKKIFEI